MVSPKLRDWRPLCRTSGVSRTSCGKSLRQHRKIAAGLAGDALHDDDAGPTARAWQGPAARGLE